MIPYVLDFVRSIHVGPTHVAYIKGGYAWQIANPTAFRTSNVDLECVLTDDACVAPAMVYAQVKRLVDRLRKAFPHIPFEIRVSPGVSKRTGCVPPNHNEWELMRPGFSYTVAYDALIGKRGQSETVRESLLYVSLYRYGPRFDLARFYATYVNSDTMALNARGLLVHDAFLAQDRVEEKGSALDEERRRWLIQKYFANERSYLSEIRTFQDVYKLAPLVYKDYVTDTMYHRFLEHFHTQTLLRADTETVESLRAFANGMVAEINERLADQALDARCFVVGGDAMRRYIPEIVTCSRDIDAKLYYRFKKDRARCMLVVATVMCRTITALQTTLNSRFRYLQQHTDWPLDLMTWDVRRVVPVTDTVNPNRTHIKLDIGLLDVAIVHRPKSSPFTNLCVTTPAGLAYATRAFLVTDIQTTYTNPRLVTMRKLRGKHEKNARRLERLAQSTNTTTTTVLDRTRRIVAPSEPAFSNYLREVTDRIFTVQKKLKHVSVRKLFKQRYRYKTFFFSSRKRRVEENRSISEKKKRARTA
tara:strand:- start:2735 stop:4327 length:1593 start_codon:yes stop_codon:yes gene_type:complete